MAAQLNKYLNREIVNMVPQIVVAGSNICQSLVPYLDKEACNSVIEPLHPAAGQVSTGQALFSRFCGAA
jgi:hypothetical protein